MLLIALSTATADSLPPQQTPPPAPPASSSSSTPDMGLIEFLGSVETDDNSGNDILTAIDTGLLPDVPEEPPHEPK